MTETTTGYTPTDEDVARAIEALREGIGMGGDPATAEFQGTFYAADGARAFYAGNGSVFDDYAAWVLATIGPIIERERRAAKVEALREWAEELDERYPTERWPELEEHETPLLLDRASASMGRVVARATRHRADEIENGPRHD